jgi:hypothetical protein
MGPGSSSAEYCDSQNDTPSRPWQMYRMSSFQSRMSIDSRGLKFFRRSLRESLGFADVGCFGSFGARGAFGIDDVLIEMLLIECFFLFGVFSVDVSTVCGSRW